MQPQFVFFSSSLQLFSSHIGESSVCDLASKRFHVHTNRTNKTAGGLMLAILSSLRVTNIASFIVLILVGVLGACADSSDGKNKAEDTVGIDASPFSDIAADVVSVDTIEEDLGAGEVSAPEDVASDVMPEPVDIVEDVSSEDVSEGDVATVEDVGSEDIALEDIGGGDKPKSPVQKLCEATDGSWDEGSCGHWKCGVEPACEAIIPGCNCGEGKVFDGGQGCIPSADCPGAPGGDGPSVLCLETGGEWLMDTCGDWFCGEEPMCEAIIPGCNCGKGMVFDKVEGCIMSKECGTPPVDDKEKVCVNSGGKWLPGTCGDWKCGVEPLCKAIIPGCNCGPKMNFHPVKGCFEDPNCNAVEVPPQDSAELCVDTGGAWLLDTCGHWKCGQEPVCEAIKPGCNCGAKMTFNLKEGCIKDPNCGPIAANDPFTLCVESGGKWDPMSCASWECGIAPKPCDKPQGGCMCGEGKILVKEYGCLESLYCDGADNQTLCEETGGEFLKDTCGNFFCGKELQNCGTAKPGCDCGEDSLFFPKYGCNTSNQCK